MYERFYAVENRGKFSDMKHTVKTKDKNGNFWRQYKRLHVHVWQEIRCSLLKKDVGTLQRGVLTPEIIGSVPKRSWQSKLSHVGLLVEQILSKNAVVSLSMPVQLIFLDISLGKQMAILKVFISQTPVSNSKDLASHLS